MDKSRQFLWLVEQMLHFEQFNFEKFLSWRSGQKISRGNWPTGKPVPSEDLVYWLSPPPRQIFKSSAVSVSDNTFSKVLPEMLKPQATFDYFKRNCIEQDWKYQNTEPESLNPEFFSRKQIFLFVFLLCKYNYVLCLILITKSVVRNIRIGSFRIRYSIPCVLSIY